ncbi:hypothetical protein [Paraferrimonas haliotis]|uniref:Uncharacterized protein n=1 Tax=Paraferrimonas haliotis TaxID=2013866 RepID=A0AA37TUJ4_9GAMM|nr:hypothetical protein [Paraferrimonas haliotis]GLS83214.1 hypothetical protein GCM10007894_11910 [Paraferrimonas haliotis]
MYTETLAFTDNHGLAFEAAIVGLAYVSKNDVTTNLTQYDEIQDDVVRLDDQRYEMEYQVQYWVNVEAKNSRAIPLIYVDGNRNSTFTLTYDADDVRDAQNIALDHFKTNILRLGS